MKVAIIGIGRAGGNVLDRLLEYEKGQEADFIRHGLAVNTDSTELRRLSTVPETEQLLLGESVFEGMGTLHNPEAGRTYFRDSIDEILAETDKVSIGQIDAFLVIAGLGGGTGGGGAPVVASALRDQSVRPVYGLGILPGNDEGERMRVNAGRTLHPFVDSTDSAFLYDNDTAQPGDGEDPPSAQTSVLKLNNEITTRFGTLLSADEGDVQTDPSRGTDVAVSDLIETLGGGNKPDAAKRTEPNDGGGITALGYAAEPPVVDIARSSGVLGSVLPWRVSVSQATDRIATQIRDLVRTTVREGMTPPCSLSSAERGLLIVAGPPDSLPRQGIQDARMWLESELETETVRVGVARRQNAEKISTLLVASGVTESERIDELRAISSDIEYSDDVSDFPSLKGITDREEG
ncbi:cell division protein [Natronomonas sp. F2-12]|jgi:cell division GTPase FtsZ|uniref:Tubulin-like protein CetZ n=1 Tax=Natronomonas aquatica TaxID=2841590 RepID=A0A9R1CRU4_9EURY|nr:cell division protein [Natronomonas aquatica]MCQ4332529.1 cell division protein [Natronomonas aquatica]